MSDSKLDAAGAIASINRHTDQAEEHLRGDHHTMGHRIDRLEDQMNERLAGMTEAFFGEVAALKSFIVQGGAWVLAALGTVIILLFNWEWEQAKENAEAHKQAAVMIERTATQLVEATHSIRTIQEVNIAAIKKLEVDVKEDVNRLRSEQLNGIEKHEDRKHK